MLLISFSTASSRWWGLPSGPGNRRRRTFAREGRFFFIIGFFGAS
jgi:hypothetical protein